MVRRYVFTLTIAGLLSIASPHLNVAAQTAVSGTLAVAGDVSTPLIADTVDGKPLSATQGPLRIVAPKDSRASRSVRMLQRLEVVRLRK